MKKRRISIKIIAVFFLTIVFFLAACQRNRPEESTSSQENTGPEVRPLDISYEEFRKVVDWINNEEILLHLGNPTEDQLAVYNIHTGQLDVIYEIPAYILSVDLSHNLNKIALQVIEENTSQVQVIDLEGTVFQTKELSASSYIGIDWNPEDDNLLFLSYPEFVNGEENIVLEKWIVDSNETTQLDSESLDTRWYSSNLYLFVNHDGDQTLEDGDLYIGDIRNDEPPLLTNSQVSEFYLHEDTFVAMTPSDFYDGDLLLTQEYPFMVEQGYLTVPKVTMNERLVFPYLSQGKRNGTVFGVLPKERVLLEEAVGKYELASLDFNEQTTHTVMDLADNAPISVSRNEQYSLYGWQFEYVIDLKKQKIHSLIPGMNHSL